jgi:hypothetical protein
MDRHRFDDFTRRFATGASRRRMLAGALAAAVGASFGSKRTLAQEGLREPGEACSRTEECSQTGGPLVCADNQIAEDGPLNCCRMENGACGQDSHCCGAARCIEGVCRVEGESEPAPSGGLALGAECTETGQCAAVSGATVICGDNFIADDGPLNCCLEEGSACSLNQECCGTVNCVDGRCGTGGGTDGAADGADGGADGGGDLAPGQFCVESSQCSQALGPAVCGDNAFSGGSPVCCLQEASACTNDQECCGDAVCADNGIAADGGLNCCGYAGAACSSDPGCCADLFCIDGSCQPL